MPRLGSACAPPPSPFRKSPFYQANGKTNIFSACWIQGEEDSTLQGAAAIKEATLPPAPHFLPPTALRSHLTKSSASPSPFYPPFLFVTFFGWLQV